MKRRLLLLLLTVSLLMRPVRGLEEYTYTVRFFAGGQGTFGGQEMVTYENLRYGDRVTFRPESVTLPEDSKYYVKGIREAGKDNNTVQSLSFQVTGDMDYVVAYGISGSSVAYQVNYQDQAGNALAPSSTYYGNVGDRPVIAYLYIDGYQPQAYNLMKTMSENSSDNEFTFVYTPISETNTAEASPSPSPTAAATETEPETTPADTNENPVAEVTQEPAQPENSPESEAAADTDTAQTTQDDETEEPREIIDLDDPETPLGDLDLSGYGTTAEAKNVDLAWLLLGGAAVLTVLLALLVLLRTKRKKKEQQDE
jgi:hypothetical protein